MERTINTDVLIVGAGPTGLSLACQLIRYGIKFVIIEKNESITPYSKAIGVHARTLEIYDQIGLAQNAIKQGTIASQAYLIVDGKIRGEIEFSNIGQGLSPYPFVLLLEQSKNEKLLYDYMQSHGKNVLWKTELENFSQVSEGVRASVKTADGKSQIIEANYLVACDGPKSLVRHTLGLSFKGSTFERSFYVADAQIDWNLHHNALHICLSKDSFVVFFPLKGEKRYRIVGVFPQEFSKDEGNILYEEIERRIKDEAKFELNIHDIEWFSTYKVHTRRVNKFFEGRCFLAGDSAHIHSPAGAQGMNTGIQDTYNLAWKLALVIQGNANEKIFATYNDERGENAKRLLQTTDRMFEIAAGSNWFLSFLRMKVLPLIAKQLINLNLVKKFIFPLLSQIGINYRRSSLSQHGDDRNFKIKAGDRMPYFLIDGNSIFDKLQQPKFHFLVFANAEDDFQALKREFESQFAGLIEFVDIKFNPTVSEIFGTKKYFCVLVRPDNYIGDISTEISLQKVHDYLSQNHIGKKAVIKA